MDIGGADEDWINSRRLQLLVKHSINHVVTHAETLIDIVQSDVLNAIFDELIKHPSAANYIHYLYKDILETRFTLESISDRAIEDQV